jgi:hypothetical protein
VAEGYLGGTARLGYLVWRLRQSGESVLAELLEWHRLAAGALKAALNETA